MDLAPQIQKHGIPMSCGRCSHEWTYTGNNKWFACCGHCRTYNSIKKHRIPQGVKLPTRHPVEPTSGAVIESPHGR